jgi:UDP-N-acetylglucosamine 2-epimerase (non-hydrolysing)
VGLPDPHAHVAQVARRIEPEIEGAELVVVQGDTSSALGGALGSAMAGVPVAHIEAGLRSHDRRNPWPEEDFRIAIDAEAELLFAPSGLNEANLRREGVRGRIVVTGNSGIDALLEHMPRESAPARQTAWRILVTCHRRESWGEGLEAIAGCLCRIADRGDAVITMVLHPNPAVAGRMRVRLGGHSNIILREPCTHFEMTRLMCGSDLVLSDSGGVQEECPALGIPLLVLREKTERPEGILSGNTVLVGRNPEAIMAAVNRLLSDSEALAAMSRPAFPYGDGHASRRIAASIVDWLADGNCHRAGVKTRAARCSRQYISATS